MKEYLLAISSAGVWTTFSCHGHKNNNKTKLMHIDFYGKYNGLWHRIIVEEFLKEIGIDLNWNYSNEFTQIDNIGDLSDSLHILILKSANCIYDIRQILIGIKSQTILNFKSKSKYSLSTNEVYQLMMECYKDCRG